MYGNYYPKRLLVKFQIGLACVILFHHVCMVHNAMFAASLLMHMCFAVIMTQVTSSFKFFRNFSIEFNEFIELDS